MGGDDLAGDEEYLNLNFNNSDSNVDYYDNADFEEQDESKKKEKHFTSSEQKSKKRKSSRDNLNDDDDDDDDTDLKNHKEKRKKINITNKTKLLLETGRNIAHQTNEIQAAFFWSCYSHFLRDKNDEYVLTNKSIFEPSFFLSASLNSKSSLSMEQFLKQNISSMKQLKKWKTVKSPMVLIISISARRATSVLKSISSLKIRTAKLFAKHLDLHQQIAMLNQTSYGIAVGTPNRLCKLTSSLDAAAVTTSLSLSNTELIIIDCHSDKKNYTVCTLNDTAPDLMEFVKTIVLPHLKRKKKPLKLAFV